MEEGGSTPSLVNLQHFRAARDLPMNLEEEKLQMHEAKRLADLKAEREKSKKKLKMLTLAQLRAQEEELVEIEVKICQHMNKMRDKYNHCINFRDIPLPITKFNYRVNKTSKITTIEWLELHALALKKQNDTNDQLLKNLKAKFQWVETAAGKLSIAPPPQLTTFELPLAKYKRKEY
ncbi:hypothetical protein Tco_0337501 [Tanacetum coccineum]